MFWNRQTQARQKGSEELNEILNLREEGSYLKREDWARAELQMVMGTVRVQKLNSVGK